MSKIAVIYWSQTGNTEAMASAVAAGAKAAGAEVSLFTAADFKSEMVAGFNALAFGCPAMGAEVLEEEEFAPLFSSCLPSLVNKKVALFGSYGWGDGQWMLSWEDDCRNNGITPACRSVTSHGAPDGDVLSACKTMGASLAA